MTEYSISCNGNSVSIALNSCDNSFDEYMKSFIDIWTDEGFSDSPFKDIETARIFAEIIVKLLKVVR